MLLTLLLQLFCDIRRKGQAAQFCWNGDMMVTHTYRLSNVLTSLLNPGSQTVLIGKSYFVPSLFGNVLTYSVYGL